MYSNYFWSFAGLYINGEATVGENIADNGGIRQAFFAYQNWKTLGNVEIELPGMSHISHNQQFFLGYSQLYCAIYTLEEAEEVIYDDVHSPNPFRVLGPLRNFEEFGKAFNCTKGVDVYYPHDEEICQVW